jgi:hypothetical protein
MLKKELVQAESSEDPDVEEIYQLKESIRGFSFRFMTSNEEGMKYIAQSRPHAAGALFLFTSPIKLLSIYSRCQCCCEDCVAA